MTYNPFGKRIDELTLDDLKTLIERGIHEGYTVEYKREFPENKKIARSIASFANTYGGWYIVGMAEKDSVADNLCGFDLSHAPDPIATVRDVIRDRINPVPVFYPKLFSLTEKLGVLVVYVPDEQETPFISDGAIYRRVSDASDPVSEKDRYAVDRLVDAGRRAFERFTRFCKDDRVFPKSDAGSWIRFFLSPYPRGFYRERLEILDENHIDELIQLSGTQIKTAIVHDSDAHFTASVPFNMARVTDQSVVLLQAKPAGIVFNSFSVEFFVDGRAKFFIPINSFPLFEAGSVKSLEAREALVQIWAQNDHYTSLDLRYFEISQLLIIIAHLFSYYLEWLGSDPLITDMQFAITANGVWQMVPFIDSDQWGAHIKKYGLPVMSKDAFAIPDEMENGLRFSLKDNITPWVEICSRLANAFGLPTKISTYAIAHGLGLFSNSQTRDTQNTERSDNNP